MFLIYVDEGIIVFLSIMTESERQRIKTLWFKKSIEPVSI